MLWIKFLWPLIHTVSSQKQLEQKLIGSQAPGPVQAASSAAPQRLVGGPGRD